MNALRPFLLVVLLAGSLSGRPAGRAVPPFPFIGLNVANGCFVESVYFYDRFRERFGDDAWVRVLQWGAKENDEVVAGHAVAVFELKNRLWIWDINYGFYPLDLPPAQRENVDRVSPLALARYPHITPRYPLYRFDFPQAPTVHPPVADPLDPNSDVRDAALVAEKLAPHRPVNLVRFSYLQDGVARDCAAVVFQFHGRYCVYTAPSGTLPFRVAGSVYNLRLVQLALRRMFPGATIRASMNPE